MKPDLKKEIEFNLSEKLHGTEEGYNNIREEDVKEFIRLLKENKRFKQNGEELANELKLAKTHDNAILVQKIHLLLTEILLEIDKLAGKELIK